MRVVQAGDVVGRYELGDEVGEGGMATVFRARDRELRRDVAIKVLFPHLARRPEIVQRFQREARAAANLEHPNILRVYDVGGGGDTGEPPYIVMELVRAATGSGALIGELERRGAMFAEVVACVGALLADALAVAHQAGVIHRDVKPSNVLVGGDGRVLLADFGVARLETEDSLVTRTGAVLGTPAYMSPEQATGDIATARSDLYSLGATLYQLATGALPRGPLRGQLVPAVKKRADVGPDLSAAIERMMAEEPDARPASAVQVAAELRAIAVAGGFGDAAEEVAAYFKAPDAFVAAKTAGVVAALIAAGHEAVAERALPRAMAIAERATLLAPASAEVAALVHDVTQGGRDGKRGKWLAGVVMGAAVIGGAMFGISRLGGHRAVAAADAAIAAVPDAVAIEVVAAPPDAATAPVAPISDAGVIGVAFVDGAVVIHYARARDAAAPPPPADAAELAIAPQDAPADAAAAPALGALAISNDVWCNVTVDHAAPIRKNPGPPLTIPVPAGHHTVTCAQDGTGRAWTREVDVAAGATTPVAGSLLGDVTVRSDIAATLDGEALGPGGHTTVPAGYHQLEAHGVKKHVDLRATCVVRDQPELDCYPAP